MIKNGGDPDEMCTDISNITQNVTRLVKEFKTFKQDTMAFNEAQLRDNSFGRWLWTRADIVNQGEFLAWDTEAANTSPQLLRWWKPQSKEHESDGNMIVVERGGLYEVSVAFFINSAMSKQTEGEQIRASQFGISQSNSINFVPQIQQSISPQTTQSRVMQNPAAGLVNMRQESEDDQKRNPISIVHLNGSTLFSAQSTPFSSYSAAS